MTRYNLSFAILMALSTFINAQVADTLSLDKIVVTASKLETTERLTTKTVDIISLKEIENSGASDLSQLLQMKNGVIINGANSNPGKDKAVYLRGAGTQYTVILIDGYPISDPSSEGGAFDLRLLPLSNIERIEIVKGSMSTLYGSDAIAGVINIITKNPEDDTFSLSGGVGFGSNTDQTYNLGISGNVSGIGYSVAGSLRDVEGISDAIAQGAGANFDKDGFSQQNITVSLVVPLNSQFTISPSFNYGVFDGKYDNGAFTDGNNFFDANFLNVGSRFKYIGTDLSINGSLTYTDTERKFVDSFGTFNPNAQLTNADVFGYYNLEGGHRLLGGVNFQKLAYELNDTNADNNLISPYLSARLFTNSGLSGEIGLRYNQHSEFGSNLTFNVAPVYNLGDDYKLLLSYSTGFKSPTLNEMFGPFGGNPELKPQRSASFDVGAMAYLLEDNLKIQLTYFKRDIDDLILYSNITFGYINADEQNDQGIELKLDLVTSFVELSTFYNYLDGSRKTDIGDVDNLLRRPTHSFGLNASKTLENGLFVGVSVQFIGERNDQFFDLNTFTSSEVNLDAYSLLDIRSSYRINEFNFFGDLKNIFNSEYTEVFGFNTPGRVFNVGVQFNF